MKTTYIDATSQQLFEHYLYAGMPEVYAAMAADEDFHKYIKYKASKTLHSSFVWNDSVLGHDFWYGIFLELKHAHH